MSITSREVYLISDLHLGGVQPKTDDPNDRGFRICTHGAELARFVGALAGKPTPVELIINGDMVDFLAEEKSGGGWDTFTTDQQAAAQKLDAIIDRDLALFQALTQFLERGHRLVLLMGNHDVELALPAVRRKLAERLGLTGRHDFQFIYDGEAYQVGRALIEHGNRYDEFNVVDYDSLRRLRSLLSRNQTEKAKEYAFAAPAGSHIVAEVMNPIKAQYRLIDLLKPENSAMVPVLMAIEPGYRKVLSRITGLVLRARKHRVAPNSGSTPEWMGDISATNVETDPLETIMRERLGGQADVVLRAVAAADGGGYDDYGGDISPLETVSRVFGLVRLLTSSGTDQFQARLPALLAAVRSVQSEATFARDVESYTEYFEAARDRAADGFDYVVFGHTHAPRDVALPAGARYLNSGSWADMIRFPSAILAGPDAAALDGLRGFVEDMANGRLAAWTSFTPTYVKMTVGDDGELRDVALCDYTSPDRV